MTRIEKILRNARITLADQSGDRFSDSDLLVHLSDGLQDFCQQTQMLHEIVDVPIYLANPIVTLPDDCWLVSRVTYEREALPLITYRELDKINSRRVNNNSSLANPTADWELDEGDPEALIYDNREQGYARIYPVPNQAKNEVGYTFDSAESNSLSTIVWVAEGDGTKAAELNSLFGLLTDIDYSVDEATLSSPYGVVADSNDTAEVLPIYGVIDSGNFEDVVETIPFGFTSRLQGTTTVDTFGLISAIGTFDSTINIDTFGVNTRLEIPVFTTDNGGLFGVVVDSSNDADISPVYGLFVDSTSDQDMFESNYGVVADIVESSDNIRVYYVQSPPEITTVEDNLQISSMWDIALQMFVIGKAFMSDLDSEYQQKGATALTEYGRYLKKAQAANMRQFSQAGQFETTYRRVI